MNGTIQGTNAVMKFYKNDWLLFSCATNISININSDKVPIRTVGDGQWQKFTYQDLNWAVTLSGLLMFDEDNWTGWDFLDNQINFVHILMQCSFTDNLGNTKSIRGTVMIESSTLNISPTDLVKNDFNLQGSGALMLFDGVEPCPTTIDSITVNNTTDPDGNIDVDYTYTGTVAQVKYRFDDTGNYLYANVGVSITAMNVANGSHSIEIIPVCLNGYEGEGLIEDFTVTRGMTCSLIVTSITKTVTGSNVGFVVNFNATPGAATLKYRVNGGSWIIYGSPLANPTSIGLSGLANGHYTFEAVPICANGVEGTGNSTTFDITTSSTNSEVDYNFTAMPGGSPLLTIYVDGILTISENATASGMITPLVGQVVLARVQVATFPRDMSLSVVDNTLSSTLYNNNIITSNSSTVTLQYTWTANGDTYTVHAVISP